MNVEWQKWEPFPNISSNYSLENVTQDGVITITLSHAIHQIKITFDQSFIFGYRQTNRDYAIEQPDDSWPFYTTKNSEFINWIVDEEGCIIAYDERVQFSVFTRESVIDIVVGSPDNIRAEVII